MAANRGGASSRKHFTRRTLQGPRNEARVANRAGVIRVFHVHQRVGMRVFQHVGLVVLQGHDLILWTRRHVFPEEPVVVSLVDHWLQIWEDLRHRRKQRHDDEIEKPNLALGSHRPCSLSICEGAQCRGRLACCPFQITLQKELLLKGLAPEHVGFAPGHAVPQVCTLDCHLHDQGAVVVHQLVEVRALWRDAHELGIKFPD
mmetsp:Transcript_35276/g.62907  ORF Transcript_35276/g.62907 Transcript_35276/m.62907 type:complete len:202 (+) Transcript_35276:375-980(+)